MAKNQIQRRCLRKNSKVLYLEIKLTDFNKLGVKFKGITSAFYYEKEKLKKDSKLGVFKKVKKGIFYAPVGFSRKWSALIM